MMSIALENKTDFATREAVERELRWAPQIREAAGIGVAVHDGVVSLTGEVGSFAELERRTAAGASLLSAADLAPGDRALILCRNSIDTIVAIWSTLRAGGVIVPVGADDRPARIRGIADDCGARLTIAPEQLAASIDGVKGVEWTEALKENDGTRRHQWIAFRRFQGQN
jgi:acyl-CoA synthetase (AMP-forming)/AMP-acid ligase II